MTSPAFPVWINGKPDDHIPANDRGLAYGDGVFETLRVEPRPVLPEFHWERLTLGLQTLRIPCDLHALRQAVHRYTETFSPGLIKLIVTRGSGGRGYLPPDHPDPLTIIQGFSLPDYPEAWYKQGIALYLCETPVSSPPTLGGIKHLNRLEQVMGRAEFAGKPCQEGLMANTAGWVEGTMSNLFLIRDETLYMPPLAVNAVKGTMQRFVTSLCDQEKLPLKELKTVSTDLLEDADRIFVCNSVFGVWPVKQLMDKDLDANPSQLFNYIQNKVMSLIS